MKQECNGQMCQVCQRKIARTESFCGVIYLCDECATALTIQNDVMRENGYQEQQIKGKTNGNM